MPINCPLKETKGLVNESSNTRSLRTGAGDLCANPAAGSAFHTRIKGRVFLIL